MRRILLFFVLALDILTIVYAQGNPKWSHPNNPQFFRPENRAFSNVPRLSPEKITISGELTIVRGSLAVKSGNTTYITMGLNRYIGFIDSLKDGASVSLEGNTLEGAGYFQDGETKILVISKLTIGGKDYDLERPRLPVPDRPAAPERPMPPFGPERLWQRRL